MTISSSHMGLRAIVIGLAVGILASTADAQTHLRNRAFLNLGSTEGYLNYGRKEYDPYPAVINARNRYDRLGNFLSRGYKVFTWEFERPGFSEITTRTAQYLGWFNNMLILSDSYRGWDYRVTMGEDIRTKLSDLTYSNPRYFGIQFDGASSDNKFSLMLSQGDDLLNIPKFSHFSSTKEKSSVLVFGGHWETRLGSMLRLGTTYFNQHMANVTAANGSFIQGDTPYNMLPPNFIDVIIEDDSPDEPGITATVYDVNVVVRGTRQGEAITMTCCGADASPEIIRTETGGMSVEDGGLEVGGPGDRVIYTFQLPSYDLAPPDEFGTDVETALPGLTIESVRFSADVAGDYRIAVRQKHLYFDQSAYDKNIEKGYNVGDSKYVNPYTGLKGDDAEKSVQDLLDEGEDVFNKWPVEPDPTIGAVNPFMQYAWDLEDPTAVSYTVLRSDGRADGAENRRVVTFDYGIPTGQALYGLDFDLTFKDTKIRGEIATNPQYFIFPVGVNGGDRHQKRRWAYFINAQRSFGSLEVGGEIFRLDPDYSGNYDSRRGGIPFFTDKCITCPQMQEMNVMTDNDDNDQWPDEFNNEKPSAEKSDSGVFPGLDENQDLVPDSDQNFNGIPDWTEPILFYDADPPEFVYGIDFNNNGYVDFRENDAFPDYPYRRDRRGWHGVMTKDGLGSFGKWISLGYYSMEEEAGGGESTALYGRYHHRFISPYFGRLEINDDLKFVKDDINDDVYIWFDQGFNERIPSPFPHLTGKNIEARDRNTQLLPPTKDPLAMRNSVVNTLFIESEVKLVSALNFSNNLQWIRNSQKKDEFPGGFSQSESVESTVTMVNKADYDIPLGNLKIKPMFKHLLLWKNSQRLEELTRTDSSAGDGRLHSISKWSPIVRIRYELTSKSNLQLGFQGFPFLRYHETDRVDDLQTFREWTTVLMMSNRSDHYGYAIATQFGMIKTDREYEEKTRESDDFNSTKMFFDVVAGF